jgi:DNA-binding YbaB/EbfC family protein
MFDKMKQLYDMQKKAKEMQRQLESLRVEKTSKDGMLKAAVNGLFQVQSLSIDPSYLAPARKENLERALQAVINEGLAEVQKQSAAQAAELMRGMPNIPGLTG